MASNPLQNPLPANLPENWQFGQIVGPNGTDVGFSKEHGYNYLMQQVNAVEEAANTLGDAFSTLADGDGTGAALNALKLGGTPADQYAKTAQVDQQLNTKANGDETGAALNALKLGGTAADQYAKTAQVTQQLSTKANVSHTQSASTITAGTFAGKVVANAQAVTDVESYQVRNIKAVTGDLTVGTAMTTGAIYLVYE